MSKNTEIPIIPLSRQPALDLQEWTEAYKPPQPSISICRVGVHSTAAQAKQIGYDKGLMPQLNLPLENLADITDVSPSNNAQISAGKNTYVYDAHTYHTKVPPEGIATILANYTRVGDMILDPFCGSGMTGIAAAESGRRAILCDLSPAASFIAENLNSPVNPKAYLDAVSEVRRTAADLELRLFGTHCRDCGRLVPMIYTVWSFGMQCDSCQNEFVLWDIARDEKPRVRDSKILSEFNCPSCGKLLKKRHLARTKRYPVEVGYRCCRRGLTEQKAVPDEFDRSNLGSITTSSIPNGLWYPTDVFPDGVNTRQAISAGITSVDKAYTPRSLWAMAFLWQSALQWPDPVIRKKLLFTVTSLYQRVTLFSEFRFWGGSSNTANYHVPAITNEQNVFLTFERKAKTIALYFASAPQIQRDVTVQNQSACDLGNISDQSIDYVFTDPPFGANINYSEMNFIWESWLQCYTDTSDEAIVNKIQGKDYATYENLLSKAFLEIRRVLKDGNWLTVVFHNSSATAWKAIQNAICRGGFTIAATQTFDKQHGTFKQYVSQNAVGYDLVLHCRKASEISANPSLPITRQTVAEFVKSQIEANSDKYNVQFLHVSRDDEFDHRRLYAEWLASELPAALVELGFEQFRNIAQSVLETETA